MRVWEHEKDNRQRKEAEASLDRRMRFQELVVNISSSLIATMPDELSGEISKALKKIGEFVGVDRVSIVWFDQNRQTAEVAYFWNKHGGVSDDLRAVERQHIRSTLEKTHGVIAGQGGAAAMLRVPASTLRSKMKNLGIQRAGRAA